MSLTYTTETPATIVSYDEPEDRKTGQPMQYRDGTRVVMVKLAVDGEEEVRSIKLDPALNAQRASVGSKVRLRIVSARKAEGALDSAGRAYARYVDKLTITAFMPAAGR